MATIIYDDEYGARTTKVFGCSFKSITAQMGFNSQPIVFTITVVEESDQDFTLDRGDIRSAQYISYGELDILGIVQSWEKTTVDAQGTGIYTVRLTDCRTVLDSANIANVYVDEPDTEVSLINTNVVYVGSRGYKEAEDGASREEDSGVLFSTVIDRVEAATLRYGNDVFEVDMSALVPLKNWQGEGVGQYYIEGEIRSLVSTITEFCNAVGAEWWVESKRKSVVDDTVVIEIKVVRRLDGLGNPVSIDLDALAAFHDGRVILRKDGYENQDVVTNKVIWGGVKRQLKQAHDIEMSQFWGFDNNGQPLSSPSYNIPSEPQGRRIPTSVSEMENVLNSDTTTLNNLGSEKSAALKRYMDDCWGKKFYYTLSKSAMSDSGNNLPDYPEVISAGWWEGATAPHGVKQFEPDVLRKMTTDDGRWGPFVQLSELFTTGSGTVDNPTQAHYVTWASGVHSSPNFISVEDNSYMRITSEQYGKYVIINLPSPLTRYHMDEDTGEISTVGRITRHDKISNAWIPLMDRGIHYGPWSNTSLTISNIPSPGRSEVSVDRDLVPWVFGVRDMYHNTAMNQLTDMANQKIETLPGLSVVNTGQLEVAGVPAVNIGQAVGLGGSITEIFIRFDANGVKTRYVMNLYTRELGEFKRKKQKLQEELQEKIEKEVEDEFPEMVDDLETPPEIEQTQEDEEDPRLGDPYQKYVYQKPEGGMGVVTAKEGGPFYAVRRTNYADIDPQTFAGGLNITESYFLSDWTNVRNLAESTISPGLIPIGTQVTVSIFSESEHGPFVAYMEQTPQVFTPPVPEED